MSDATTDTNDHAAEAAEALRMVDPTTLQSGEVTAYVLGHALLAITQELAALRRTIDARWEATFAPREYRGGEVTGDGGSVIEALYDIRDSLP